MYYEFYLDQYFLENLMMNYMVLMMMEILSCERLKRKRMLAASLLGALLTSIAVCVRLYDIRWMKCILSILIETIIIITGFRICSFRRILDRTVTFRLLSFLMEGSWSMLRKALHISALSGMTVAILLPFFLLLMVKRNQNRSNYLYPVTITLRGKSIDLMALWDSGNQLRMPFTGRPVHIIDDKVIQKLLTLREYEEMERILNLQTVEESTGIFKIIPYRSLGKENGLLPVLTLNQIVIEKKKEKTEISDALVAVSKNSVSSDGAYQMILHP